MTSPGSALERRAQQRIGMTLKGKYTLERVLGVGGMAAVYLGVHRNGLRVAVKVLHAELSLNDAHSARFVREGYVANAIEHPGAVRVLDDDVAEDGARFLVMELLEGETLEARCARLGGRLPISEALVLGHKLLDALSAAHEKGIVHRDIKPENVFVTINGELKILDFGIARMTDPERSSSATNTGLFMGTPAFMPPEQALGRQEDVDARVDVWAVGATLFKLISGSIVHVGETMEEVVISAATQPARSLAAAAPDAPPALVVVIDRALRFYKDQRWPDAAAMRAAIAEVYAALEGEPIESASLPPSPSLRQPRSQPAGAISSRGVSSRGVSSRGVSSRGVSSRGALASAPTLDGPAPSASADPSSLPTLPDGIAEPPPPPSSVRRAPSNPSPPPSSVSSPPPPPPPARPRRARALAIAALSAALLGAAGAAFALRTRALAGEGDVTRGSALAASAQSCATNAECVAKNQGKPSICRKNKDKGGPACVALETSQCHIFAQKGDVENDSTVWIGAMFPETGPEEFGKASMNAVDLARRDFAETSSGLPAVRPGEAARPLAVVACDDTEDPRSAAKHLVDDVGVAAVLGFARSKEVLDLAQEIFVPKGVLTLASNTATMLSSIPHPPGKPRLVLRTTTSATMAGEPLAAIVSQLVEPELRSPGGPLSRGEPMRVALARVANPTGLSYAELFVSILQFNGKSVPQNGGDFLQVVIPDIIHADKDRETEADIAPRAAEIIAFRPHVVLGFVPELLVEALERGWPKTERFRPRYVTGSASVMKLRSIIREHPDLRARIFATETSSTTEVITKYVMRYNEVFSPKVTSMSATVAPYDAFYLLAYAAAALGDAPITGESLARAVSRLLPPGPRIDVGPAGIYPTLHALEEHKNVDLNGAATSLDFNQDTGDPTADFVVFTVGGRGDEVEMVESGMVFDARSRKLTGSLRAR